MTFNDWLDSTVRKAQRLIEDSDRKVRADVLFIETIKRAHWLATAGAHRTTRPEVQRHETEEGVLLCIEWFDQPSNWHLYLGVNRKLGDKRAHPVLDFSGATAVFENYSLSDPDDRAIQRAFHDYFQAWK